MVDLSEDELKNFCKVWASILASLTYCYYIGRLISKGFPRMLAMLPIMALFLVLPLYLTSIFFGGLTAFFIAWLANFKLLLFAFDKGPLSPPSNSSSPLSFPHFLALACLPIQIIHHDPRLQNCAQAKTKRNPDEKSQKNPCPPPQNLTKRAKSAWNHIKVALFFLIFGVYKYGDFIQPQVLMIILFVHIYVSLETILALLAKSATFLLGCELEPQFKEPLFATSLQDFWGRRWNLMASKSLWETVYLPTLDHSPHILGQKWAPLAAVMATFMVSGAMHELMFYYLGRRGPTFEATWFFLLHGWCLGVEVVVKRAAAGRRWRVSRWVSGPATVGFVVGTGVWLFLPPLQRAGLGNRCYQEYVAFGRFVGRFWRSISA